MKEFERPLLLWSVVVVWIAICTVVVFGFVAGMAVYFSAALIGGILLGIIITVVTIARSMGLWWLPAFLYVVPSIVWFFVGQYNGWRDYLILTVILVIVGTLGGKAIEAILACRDRVNQKSVRNIFQDILARANNLLLSRRSDESARKVLQVMQAGTYLLLVWAVVSLADHLMGPYWSSQSPLLQTSVQSQISSGESDKQAVALALSGGGYRAAIMHAGVLDALERFDLRVTALSTVSGGSIIGGFYALGGTPQSFKDAVIERRFNLYRDMVSVHNLLRFPMPGRITFAAFGQSWKVPVLPIKSDFTRTDVLAQQLARVLFGEASLSDVAQRSGLLWIIGTTDLLSGDAVGVSAAGVYRRALPVLDETESMGYLPRRHNAPTFEQTTTIQPDSVSRIIAASSAFPGAFAPIALEYRVSRSSKQPAVNLLLADGGVTDNSGLALLLAAWKYSGVPSGGSSHPFDVVIASNGGKGLRPKGSDEEFSRPFRALDVIYAASGVYVPESEGREHGGPEIIALTPERTLPESSQAVRALIDWAARQDHSSPPIRQQELHEALERELSDQMLSRFEPITRPENLAQSWHLVLQKSELSAFDDERMTARLDVVLDFIHAADVFERTSTLNDTLPKDDVEALFRLGRYLVYLRDRISDLNDS